MSKCKKYQEWLTLYAAGELSSKERVQLEAHLEKCHSCATELRAQEAFLGKLARRPAIEPRSALLDECRAELRERLRLERRVQMAPSWWERLSENLITPLHPIRVLVGAAVLLVIGFVVGRYILPSPQAALRGPLASDESAQALVAFEEGEAPDIHSIRFDPATQQVELHLSAARTYSVTGRMEDENIRKMLSYALRREENPGLRMRSVKAIAAQPYADDDVEAALVYALENDPNAGVRLQALKVLKELPLNKQIKDALIRVLLRDKSPSMRKEAVDALSEVRDNDVLSAFRGAAKRDTSTYVRLKASKILERRED